MPNDTMEQTDPRTEAKLSETGKRMTDSQFDEAWQVVGIINREIHKSGSFIEKLTDYAHAFARNERFDSARGELILRDLYSERYGQSMNQTREALLENETQLREAGQELALQHAQAVLDRIEDGPTMPFWKALDRSGLDLAADENVSESFARSLIKESFEEKEGQSFYKVAKAHEEKYYRPPAKTERGKGREKTQARQRSYARSGPSR